MMWPDGLIEAAGIGDPRRARRWSPVTDEEDDRCP
jgi:hypothetical protein